jgi:hypothetical protein
MKLGVENRAKLVIMFVLAIAAAFMGGRSLNLASPSTGNLPAVSKAGQLHSRSSDSVEVELAKVDEGTEYRGSGRNIFRKIPSSKPRPPQPSPPPQEKGQIQVSLPAIGLKFFGFATKIGHAMRVFLTEGEEVFIAGEGEIVNRRYRVVRIGPSWVEIEDVLTNHSENIPLTQG